MHLKDVNEDDGYFLQMPHFIMAARELEFNPVKRIYMCMRKKSLQNYCVRNEFLRSTTQTDDRLDRS